MFECMLFGRAEEPHGHERPPPRSRNPAGNFQSELGGSVVVTQLPPSLSSRNPITPVSGHESNPNGANAVAGSQYVSFPFNFTSTTSPFNSNAFIICGLKKYSLRDEMYTEYASN